MIQNRSVEIGVGVFVVIGMIALGILALNVGNLGSESGNKGYHLIARFDNIGGLTVKAPVTVSGVRIGRVTNITVDPEDFRAVVEMTISNQYTNFSSDTSAAILTSGVLGAKYIGLEPGGEEEVLKEGDEIEITGSAVVLERLIGQFMFNKAGDGNP